MTSGKVFKSLFKVILSDYLPVSSFFIFALLLTVLVIGRFLYIIALESYNFIIRELVNLDFASFAIINDDF